MSVSTNLVTVGNTVHSGLGLSKREIRSWLTNERWVLDELTNQRRVLPEVIDDLSPVPGNKKGLHFESQQVVLLQSQAQKN